MGVAALSFGIGSQLGIEPKNMDFSSRLGRTAVQTGVSTAVSAAKGGDIGQLLLQAGANIAASAVSCAVADEISTWYSNGDIDGVVHKLCHAGSGFLQGMASNLEDPLRGGIGGAFAGLAEGMFEALPESLSKEARANIAIMGAATAAFLAKQDVNAAALTATNAVMHNSCSGEEEKADKDDKGKEEATSSRSNEDTEIEANGITRPKSPRNSEAYIERCLQFGRTNIVDPLYEYVIDPLTQLPVIREVVAFDAEIRQGVGVLMQASEVLERSGYYGALPRNPLTLPGKVEELTNIVASGLRRDCRVMGGSPAFCQDIGDAAKFGFILLTTRGTGGARAVVGQGAVAEAAAGKAFTTEGIVFKGVRDVESVSLNGSRGFQPKVAANYNSPAGDLAESKIHRNSLKYVGDTHLYVIRDAETGKILKYGESACGMNTLGQSKRAQIQVRRLQKQNPDIKYESEIINEFSSKIDAKSAENKYIITHKKVFGQTSLPLNKTNH